jgi:hypothetical protein
VALGTNALNVAANAVTGAALYMSLHSASPGANGANELTGGSPAYARQALTWGSASGGVASVSGTVSFNIPAGSTVAYVGLWSASTSGTWYGAVQLASSESYTGQGVYQVTAASLTAT